MLPIRHLEPEDYDYLSPRLDERWGGRPVAAMVPRLFFQHFRPTSFAIEQNGEIVAFLIGFCSQTTPTLAYIHFVGVAPTARRAGWGRLLYEHFFETVANLGCIEVQSITSPINEGSLRFHRAMGFDVLPGDGEVNGIPVTLHHGGNGQPRVRFSKILVAKHRSNGV